MPKHAMSLTASAANLRRLTTIRLIFIFSLLAALFYAHKTLAVDTLHPAYLATLLALILLNAITYWRLRQAWPVTDLEYFSQLLTDVAALTVLLYVSGGATNPFVSYYLVPLTISAAILPWHFTWIIAGLSLLSYSLMLFFYQPLAGVQAMSEHSGHGASLNLHVVGMWVTFALSTALITYFVVKMATALKQQQNDQVAHRENELLNEQILAVATLAAGTAHELGTPLATMTVLLDELQLEYQHQPELNADLSLLKEQAQSCKRILQGLVSTAEAHNHGQAETVNMGDYMQGLLNRWQVLRPEANFQFTSSPSCQQQTFNVELTLEQALCNILNNAADACPDNISISLTCNNGLILITIRDHGAGIPLEIAEQISKPFVTTKGKGLGLGLFLSHATINRYGGKIELFNHPEGGTLAEITLPLERNFFNKSPVANDTKKTVNHD